MGAGASTILMEIPESAIPDNCWQQPFPLVIRLIAHKKWCSEKLRAFNGRITRIPETCRESLRKRLHQLDATIFGIEIAKAI